MERYKGFRSSRRKAEFLAGRWALKEALTKALTSLLGREKYKSLNLKMSEVSFLSGEGKLVLPERVSIPTISASITHTRDLAMAIVIALKEDSREKRE